MITSTGREVWPLTLNHPIEAPSIFDIGTGLSRTPRFAGQTRIFYPVLAHVLTVAEILPDPYKAYGLLHDAGEAIVGDQVSTWKNEMTKADEEIILCRISKEFGLPYPWGEQVWEWVKWADSACLRAEAKVLEHYSPNHEHFLSCPYHEEAHQYTGFRALTPANLWIKYGYGGIIYEDAVRDALRLL
jgi:hypothetical protein